MKITKIIIMARGLGLIPVWVRFRIVFFLGRSSSLQRPGRGVSGGGEVLGSLRDCLHRQFRAGRLSECRTLAG